MLRLNQNASSNWIPSRRSHLRIQYDAPCTVHTATRQLEVYPRDLSSGGMSFELRGLAKLERDQTISVFLEDLPPINAIVRWTKDRAVGVEFVPMPDGYYPSVQMLLEKLGASENQGDKAPLFM